jgi:hypothetical protein
MGGPIIIIYPIEEKSSEMGFRNKYDMEELRGVAQIGDKIGLNDF